MDLNIQELSTLLTGIQQGKISAAQQKKALQSLEAIVNEKARQEYWFYVWYTNKGQWKPGRFHKYLCDQVQQFIETDTGHAYDILILNTPPQHGKSTSVTEALPSWMQGKFPDKKGILLSYNDETALRFMKSNKDKISEYGLPLFGAQFDEDLNRADVFRIKGSSGYVISRGLGGGITSYTANWMLIDDPVKSSSQADSELNRQRANLEWNMTLKTRLMPGAKVIIIMTPWHEVDLGGYVQQVEDPSCVRVIKLPCEAEENDPLGRAVGEALAPEIGRGNEWMAQFKRGFMTSEGTRAWTAMYQCRPTSLEGNMLKRDWWRQYRRRDMPTMIQRLISVDATFKDTKTSDFVSIQLWGKRGAFFYLIDRDKRRMDFPSTLDAIRGMVRRHNHKGIILIEDKANGSAAISVLKREIPGIIPVKPEGGKVSRVNAVSHVIESGNVYLPHEDDCPWIIDFIEECASFPSGKHDDDVDAMSQALNRFMYFDATIPKEGAEADEDDERDDYTDFLNYGT
jgi:predicted phage terminase large subunit-like protein